MATFIGLVSFTDQGVRNVKDTTKRAETVKQMAAKAGVKLKDIYWTLGQYDLVSIWEAPDAETLLPLLFALGAQGNVRTQTLRAFNAEEVGKVISRMP